MKTAYLFDEVGIYCGEQDEQRDDLASRVAGHDVYLLPANATEQKPPEEKDGYLRRWNCEKWEYIADPAIEPKHEQTEDEKKANMLAVRNMLLIVSDKYALPDFPETDEERKEYYDYRQYLRDYPNKKSVWWENPPLDFDEWRKKDDEKR